MDTIREEDIDEMHNLDVKQSEKPFTVDAFKEPNRRVVAKCRACGFEIHGPLLRVATDTGYPCVKCGALGAFVIYDASAGRRTGADSPPFDVNTGPRQPMAQGETNTPDEADIVLVPPTPLRQPYPPVRYEWEIEE